jgi:phage terminase large subunit
MATKTLKIDFNPNLFNNVFWHLRKAFKNPLIRFIWLFGGSSASKTYSVVQLQIILMLTGKGENALVLRKYGTDILDSIYADFKGVIAGWQLEKYFILQKNYIVCTQTGSYVRFRGLDDSEKVKGISNFKRAILEEVSQFDYDDLKQIRKRLRGKEGQQIIGIFNPISEEHWIKTEVFDKEELQDIETDISGMQINAQGNLLILKTNYLDNVFIVGKWEVDNNGELKQVGGFVDQHTIDDFEKDKITDFNYYQIYGLGNWGKIRTGGEFWKDFNSNKHVLTKEVARWQEDEPIHLSWDENVNPYLTCLVWQLSGKVATQIDEICLPDPNNRRLNVCNEFKKRYPAGRVRGLYIYGDRTSLKEDTGKEKGENFFTDILKYLNDYRPSLRLQNKNPSIKDSADFINSSYAGRTALTIRVSEKCSKSIHDYQYALEDSDGTLKKTKKTNPVTKVSYEEFGHPSDAKRYILTVAYAEDYLRYLNKKPSNIRTQIGRLV